MSLCTTKCLLLWQHIKVSNYLSQVSSEMGRAWFLKCGYPNSWMLSTGKADEHGWYVGISGNLHMIHCIELELKPSKNFEHSDIVAMCMRKDLQWPWVRVPIPSLDLRFCRWSVGEISLAESMSSTQFNHMIYCINIHHHPWLKICMMIHIIHLYLHIMCFIVFPCLL